MANRRLYPFWNHLTTALRSGLPQNEIRDGSSNPFAVIYAEPTRLKECLKAMSAVSHGANVAIAHKFPWNKCRTAVDVGTAQGDLITQVALANPHIEGIGFDLPEVWTSKAEPTTCATTRRTSAFTLAAATTKRTRPSPRSMR
ncbi:MAG TPA: methyltransferase [Candidatus Polarisedimenticolia bacterium]|nr:methyltransferase [Candidatus Polarisedimenticolia bacterium]